MSQKEAQEVDVFEAVQLIFSGIAKFLINSLLFLNRNKLKIILITIIGSMIGFGVYQFHDKTYRTELVFKSNGLSAKELINTLNQLEWKSKLGSSTYKTIRSIYPAYVLDLNEDNIWDIVEYNRNHHKVVDIKILNQRLDNEFAIVIESKEKIGKDAKLNIETLITDFVNNNKKAQEAYHTYIKNKKNILERIDIEIAKLDYLNHDSLNYSNQDMNADKIGIYLQKDKSSYKEALELLQMKQDTEKSLIMDTMPCQADQASSEDYLTISPIDTLSKYFIISLLISIIYSLLIEFKSRKKSK